MNRLPDSDHLLWGDSSDRRRYYFKMGVTNSLRRSGTLESLSHLYRYQGVNYDVEEAYRLAGQDCPQLASAERLDLNQLLALGPSGIQQLVHRGLIE